MTIVRGRVSGRVVLLEEELPDGAEVEVRVREDVEVTDADWAALMEAAESVKRGTVMDAETVLAALQRRCRQ